MLMLVLSAVLAHGSPPQTLQILERPGTKLVGTTFGALISSDDCRWQWLCDKSIGYPNTERPTWYLASNGSIFAAAYSGLYRSDDQGCSWSKNATFDDTGAVDITGEGATQLVVTGQFQADNGIFRSKDNGVSFERVPLVKSTEYFSAVRMAGTRVYVSSWYFEPKVMALWVSQDTGETFTRIVLTDTLPLKGPFTVHAIAPGAADTVYASVFDDVAAPQTSHLFKSTDAGKTWAAVFSAPGRVTQVVFSGETVWAAIGNFVFRSEKGGVFTALAEPTSNACVFQVGGKTLACGSVAFDGFAIADVSDGTAKPWLEWNQITGPAACPAGSAGATACSAGWPVERYELGLEDAGTPECISLIDPPEPRAKPTCSCDASPSSVIGLALLAIALGVSSRSRRSRPPT